MEEKTILITGSTDGIGEATAIRLAKLGHHILIHGRNSAKGEKVLTKVNEYTQHNKNSFLLADLSSLEQVNELANKILQLERLDVLINNAGVYMNSGELSRDGYEYTFAVNHLAPFSLTLQILPLLVKSRPSRIINVASMVHSSDIDFSNLQAEKRFSGYEAYARSKLCNILFTCKLAEKLEDSQVSANCLHPGVINTKLLRKAFGGGSSPSEGAKTPVYLATSSEVKGITGKYFVDRRSTESKPITYDKEAQNILWKKSEQLTGIKWKDIDLGI